MKNMREHQVKINYKKLLEILPTEEFMIFTDNVYCSNCGTTKIVDFEENILLNELYDVSLQGKCGKCSNKIGRYIETGEDPQKVNLFKKILRSQHE